MERPVEASAAGSAASAGAIDAASSAQAVHRLVLNKRLAEARHQQALARQQERRRRREDEDDEDIGSSEEEPADADPATDAAAAALEAATRRRVRAQLVSFAPADASTPLESPLAVLVALQAPSAPPPVVLSSSLAQPAASEVWSAEIAAAASAADAAMQDIDWEMDEPAATEGVAAAAALPRPLAALHQSEDEAEWTATNDEVLFGEDDEVALPPQEYEDEGEDQEMASAPSGALEASSAGAASAASSAAAAASLNKVVVATAGDSTAAAASSVAAQEGALTISFEALSNEQVAAQIRHRKAEARAQKQEEKSQKEASKPKGKRKLAADSEATATSKRPRKGKSEQSVSSDEDDSAAPPSTSKKKRVASVVPAQRLTKSARDLLTHIHHVHILSLLSLIQLHSSPHPAVGILTDELLTARLLSLVLNRCPGVQAKEWVVDPRKSSVWIGANAKKRKKKQQEGTTSKTAADLSSPSAPLAAAAGLSSPSPLAAPSSPSSSPVPPAAHGTIFDRVQKIAYWFRSYFDCHSDRIDLPASDKNHPLHAYDTHMHVRMLNELRCTCVRQRIIHAAVKKRAPRHPWRHYKACAMRQLAHVLETREGGFQHLTMLFVMILRAMGVLTRLCYGIAAVNYKANIVFPKAEEQQQMSEAVREGLGKIMDDEFRGQFGGASSSSSSRLDSAALISQMVREQAGMRQDPRALRVLDAAVREPCPCRKPFRPVIFGTPLKPASDLQQEDPAAAAELSPPPLSTPRKSPHFVGTKSEAIEILDSDDDDELSCVVVKSPHFSKAAPSPAAATPTAAKATSRPFDSDFESPLQTTASRVPAPAAATTAVAATSVAAKNSRVKKKLDVDPPKRARSASIASSLASASAGAASSGVPASRARAAKSKKPHYVESDESETESESEVESNPCTECGANESTDEVANPILLCDDCDAAICFRCVKPSLTAMPESHLCQACTGKAASKKAEAAKTKASRPAARNSRKAKSAAGDVDLTSSSTKAKAKSRPRLTKARSAQAGPGDSTTPRLVPHEISDISDSDFDARTPASSARAAAQAAEARAAAAAAATAAGSTKKEKLPKKQFFEHGYPLIWCEFYCPEEKRWIHVDVIRRLFDSEYVYEHDGGITWQCVLAVRPSVEGAKHLLTDVTKRYTRKWSAVAAQRVDEAWFSHQVRRMSGECAAIDRDLEQADAAELSRRHALGDELPTRVNEFKLHPLFCIDKFALKFEMIYPSGPEHSKWTFVEKKKATADAPPAEIIHLVYPRSSLHVLHTVDRWRREQRAVKHDEIPYPVKVVKRLVQMSRAQREEKIRLGLLDPEGEKSELYGIWQTEPWMPEAAQNGIVPKNERGHVDVWGASHIPAGCVHLPYPRVKAACKKLGCDFADAMTGFDVKGGRSVPRFEGVVICSEFEEPVMKLYRELERAVTERAEKRRMNAITSNWIKLVRGSIVHTRVMREVMKGADNNELAFVPATAAAAAAAAHPSTASAITAPSAAAAATPSLSSTPYSALATTLHAASIAASASSAARPHFHEYSQRSFDLATNAWISVCACGSRQSIEEI